MNILIIDKLNNIYELDIFSQSYFYDLWSCTSWEQAGYSWYFHSYIWKVTTLVGMITCYVLFANKIRIHPISLAGQSFHQTPVLPRPPGPCALETPSAAPVNAILITQQQKFPRARRRHLSAAIVSKNLKPFILTNCCGFIWTKGPRHSTVRAAGGGLQQRGEGQRWDTV